MNKGKLGAGPVRTERDWEICFFFIAVMVEVMNMMVQGVVVEVAVEVFMVVVLAVLVMD